MCGKRSILRAKWSRSLGSATSLARSIIPSRVRYQEDGGPGRNSPFPKRLRLLDEETRRIAEEGEQRAGHLLEEHLTDALAGALLEKETLSGGEIRTLLANTPVIHIEADNRAMVSAQVRSKSGAIDPCHPARRRSVYPSGGIEEMEDESVGDCSWCCIDFGMNANQCECRRAARPWWFSRR
jgi:hypothetical protein